MTWCLFRGIKREAFFFRRKGAGVPTDLGWTFWISQYLTCLAYEYWDGEQMQQVWGDCGFPDGCYVTDGTTSYYGDSSTKLIFGANVCTVIRTAPNEEHATWWEQVYVNGVMVGEDSATTQDGSKPAGTYTATATPFNSRTAIMQIYFENMLTPPAHAYGALASICEEGNCMATYAGCVTGTYSTPTGGGDLYCSDC